MLKFYRSLGTIRAISFDLDDCLYSNRPIMVAAEREMTRYFAETLAPFNKQNIEFKRQFWWPFRTQIKLDSPQLTHDVTEIRRATYTAGILSLCNDQALAAKLADNALTHFLAQRSNFKVPDLSLELLQTLSEKLPLVAISNGNVDVEQVGLAPYFKHFLHADIENKRKPDTDMFNKASQLLAIPQAQILHVGDCGKADVLGALRAGMQVAWLNRYDVGKPITVLPHIELTDIQQLHTLF